MNADESLVVLTIQGPLEGEDKELLKDNNWNYLESHRLTGGSPIVDLVVVLSPLAPLAISSITSIIEKYIENKKYIKIKIGDVEIENANIEEIIKVLEMTIKMNKNKSKRRK